MDEITMELTPKGQFLLLLKKRGIEFADGDELWHQFEGWCVKRLSNDESYAALIFDGEGGMVIGAELTEGRFDG